MGTLKARVSGSWVPILGSGQEAAATVRWNSAWGMVAKTDYGDNINIPGSTSGVPVGSVTFTAVAGRQYRAHMYVPVVTNAGAQVSFDIYNNGTQLNVGGGWLSSSSTYDARVLTWPLWRAGSFSGSCTIQIRANGSTATAMNFYRESLWIEDLGPITPASIAPPSAGPRVVASGNALGIVQMGSFLAPFAAHSVAANTDTWLTNPLVSTMAVGRRYRLFFQVRAIEPVGAVNTNVSFYLRDNGTAIRNWPGGGDPYVYMGGPYQGAIYTWLFDGDGVQHSLEVLANGGACNIYTDYGQYYLEDVGPNTSPALPIPATPPAWTPITPLNSWANEAGVQIARYRKIGDVVSLQGTLTKSGASPAGTMFTLPAGFRPPGDNNRWMTGVHTAGVGGIFIARATTQSNGDFVVLEYSSAINNPVVYLNGIDFSTTP